MGLPVTVDDRVRVIIATHLGCEPDFGWDADLAGNLGADSLDAFEIAMSIDEEFGIEFPDATVQAWRTPRDVLVAVGTAFD